MPTYDTPHRRFNPLTGEWVLVSPHRARRPWLGQVEKKPPEDIPAYDPACYLCPGNSRAGGVHNPNYDSTFVFDNDFPALLPPPVASVGEEPANDSNLFHAEPVAGICRVVCFSPRHDLTLPELPLSQVEAVVSTWADQTRQLGGVEGIHYVQVFENKGEMMGCSNPHPHSQIWSTSYLPNEPAKELAALMEYQARHNGCLLCHTLHAELADGARVFAVNDHFVALAPYWAVWPFETLVISRSHLGSLTDLNASQISGLASILRQVTVRYDNLFEVSFPYSMGFHQAPVDGASYPQCHLHAHFYPPLLRSATVRKFMVGFEMLAMPQRDLTPETAAERLRAASPTHYRHPEN
jgi:UDPglucose--hexose-1-phosphate uridylyltransferase